MTTFSREVPVCGPVVERVDQAIEHISGICFKTGPPRRIGAELEWTVHVTGAPTAYVEPAELRSALGAHAPPALGGPGAGEPLPGGGTVTIEPGGQLEISSAPAPSLTALHDDLSADRAHLVGLLGAAGLELGASGIDPHRPPRRLLHTPRYAAMQRRFDAAGPAGHTMMCSTAGLQVCLDAGPAERLPHRWRALHEMGPALLAAFATSRRHAGRDTGWASARMAAWYGIERGRTRPVTDPGTPAADPAANREAEPATEWARYALAAPLLCVRRDTDRWDAPPGISFADWIAGALPDPPTVDDLDYHLGTLFPPVRPRGYLEVRYLDAQPGGEWIAPVAVLAALLADDTVTDAARSIAAATADRWVPAARAGLADPAIRDTATALLDLACRRLELTGLPPRVRDDVAGIVDRRLHHATNGKDPHR